MLIDLLFFSDSHSWKSLKYRLSFDTQTFLLDIYKQTGCKLVNEITTNLYTLYIPCKCTLASCIYLSLEVKYLWKNWNWFKGGLFQTPILTIDFYVRHIFRLKTKVTAKQLLVGNSTVILMKVGQLKPQTERPTHNYRHVFKQAIEWFIPSQPYNNFYVQLSSFLI